MHLFVKDLNFKDFLVKFAPRAEVPIFGPKREKIDPKIDFREKSKKTSLDTTKRSTYSNFQISNRKNEIQTLRQRCTFLLEIRISRIFLLKFAPNFGPNFRRSGQLEQIKI